MRTIIFFIFMSLIANPLQGVVSDPYAWLEEMESQETRAWVASQNERTDSFLGESPFEERVTYYADRDVYSMPVQRGKYLFYLLRQKGQTKANLWKQNPDGTREILVDMQNRSGCLVDFSISRDGGYLAYGISEGGSDLQTWRCLSTEGEGDFPIAMQHVKFVSPVWNHDNSGMYAVRWDDKRSNLYFHGVEGGEVSLPIPHPPDSLIYDLHLLSGGDTLLLLIKKGTSEEKGVHLFNVKEHTLQELFRECPADYHFLGEREGNLYFITDRGASNKKIISLSSTGLVREIVPEKRKPLVDASLQEDCLVCSYLVDCSSQLETYSYQGEFLEKVPHPAMGTCSLMGDRERTSTLFFSYTDFTHPATIYRYSGKRVVPLFPSASYEEGNYVTEQVFFPSKDGTAIPMFITRRRGIRLDRSHPTLLYGYGGFCISVTPSYSPLIMTWLERGGIYASANIRGGGEYGKRWHREGKGHRKQNVFDDFIAAGEWLVANGYTTKEKLAIYGRSNGGLLVGACVTQRPDLFGAAIAQVGVLDMLRFHLFTIGWAWMSDYGNPDDPKDFPFLYAYSPYHRVQVDREYPPTLVMAADHDDRVVPLHSYKFAARMQEAQGTTLLRIYPDAGHQGGASLHQQVKEYTEILRFLERFL